MTIPANPAATADLQARFYRELTPREDVIAQQWLDDAWGMLTDRRPTLGDDLTAGAVREATVIRVVVGMVSRVFSNPESLVEESIDDYRKRRDSAISSGELYVSANDIADITPGRKTRRSIRLVAYGEYP